jgi:phosphorylase kinase alpha/beta subunit
MVPDPESGCVVVPELYSVPKEVITSEEIRPGSQERIPSGRVPFMWAQALYVIGKLMDDDLLAIGELDPLNRRMSAMKRPAVTVQVRGAC